MKSTDEFSKEIGVRKLLSIRFHGSSLVFKVQTISALCHFSGFAQRVVIPDVSVGSHGEHSAVLMAAPLGNRRDVDPLLDSGRHEQVLEVVDPNVRNPQALACVGQGEPRRLDRKDWAGRSGMSASIENLGQPSKLRNEPRPMVFRPVWPSGHFEPLLSLVFPSEMPGLIHAHS